MDAIFIKDNPELFLEGLEGFKYDMFKEYLNQCCDKYINNDVRYVKYGWFILPITRRIIDGLSFRIDFDIDEVVNTYIWFLPTLENLKNICLEGIDIEAEYCSLISKIMIYKLNNK